MAEGLGLLVSCGAGGIVIAVGGLAAAFTLVGVVVLVSIGGAVGGLTMPAVLPFVAADAVGGTWVAGTSSSSSSIEAASASFWKSMAISCALGWLSTLASSPLRNSASKRCWRSSSCASSMPPLMLII